MGHSTNTGFVHLTTATEYLSRQREDRARFRFAQGRPSIEEAAITCVVDTWRDEECERFEDARLGATSLTPPLTLDLAERAVDSFALPSAWQVSSAQTVVVPVLDDADVTVVKQRITVNLSPEDAAALVARLASGESGVAATAYRVRELALGQLGPGVVSVSVAKSPKLRSIVAKATEGAAALEYYLFADNTIIALPAEAASSQSKARQAAVAYAESRPTLRRVEVRARLVRPDTAALVVVERPEPTSTSSSLDVKVATVKPNAAIIGYYVAFDSHR